MYGGHRKGKRGWGAAGKHIVFGMYQRNGFVFTFPVPDRRISTLIPLAQRHSRAGSLYCSDDWHGYTRLSVRVTIFSFSNIEACLGLKGAITSMESKVFGGFSKHCLYQYRGTSQDHFPLHLRETEHRFNYRDKDFFLEIAKQVTQTRYQ